MNLSITAIESVFLVRLRGVRGTKGTKVRADMLVKHLCFNSRGCWPYLILSECFTFFPFSSYFSNVQTLIFKCTYFSVSRAPDMNHMI